MTMMRGLHEEAWKERKRNEEQAQKIEGMRNWNHGQPDP